MGNTPATPHQQDRQLNYSFSHLRNQPGSQPAQPTQRPTYLGPLRQPQGRPQFPGSNLRRQLQPYRRQRNLQHNSIPLQPNNGRSHSPLPLFDSSESSRETTSLHLPPPPSGVPKPHGEYNSKATLLDQAPTYEPHSYSQQRSTTVTKSRHHRRQKLKQQRRAKASKASNQCTNRNRKPNKPPGVKLATYNNMQDGRNNRLTLLARNLEEQQVGLCLATEAKIPNEVHTKARLWLRYFLHLHNKQKPRWPCPLCPS
ncbi:hypothetical protein SEMRO_2186_G318160.1 [Seminavis robusta]|uniref:Uncharacterized protein n=1 Tax=Seminavis robusta TaxID=568900 RepID=A0A9N8HZ67_9STRA|nr:hypothetical protein SEMRO_2186_G318160.1 [Seminavis robusta]|eukprot:Sro2186_g318160.1 n/a (256) ;mRNA; f:13050-13817